MSESGAPGRRVLLAALAVVSMAAPARAQWVITPQLGINVAGDVEFRRGGPGASLGYLGSRLGLELEFQRYHHFFKDSEIAPLDPAAPPNCRPGGGTACADLDTDAMSFMANVVVPFARGGAKWRPYATVGAGMIRAWTNEPDRAQNNHGFDVGGGVIRSLGRRAGLRGDVRYTRAFVNENEALVYRKDYGFWRVTLGITGSTR